MSYTKAHLISQEAVGNNARLVVLPEMWNCPYENSSFGQFAEDIDNKQSKSVDLLANLARQHAGLWIVRGQTFSSEGLQGLANTYFAVTIVGGSIPEVSEGKLYNTCCVFGPAGELIAKHRKVHLFDIDIPNNIRFMESDTLAPGNSGTLVDTGRLLTDANGDAIVCRRLLAKWNKEIALICRRCWPPWHWHML